MEWWPRFRGNVKIDLSWVWGLHLQVMLGLIWRICWTRIKSEFAAGFGRGVALH